MATIKNKKCEIRMENPNGSIEQHNNLTEFSILYNEYKRFYYLNLTPCTLNDLGGISYIFDFQPRNVPLIKVTRRSAKTQRTCEEFMLINIEALNTAYINNGMAGVEEVVRDLWHIA